VGYAINGFRDVYPEMGLIVDRYLNDEGKKMLADVAEQCLFQTAAQYGLHSSSEYTTTGESVLDIIRRTPEVDYVLAENKLGFTRPAGSFWLDSATSDDIVPYPQAEQLARDWCRIGGNIRFLPQLIPDIAPRSGVGHLSPQHFEFAQAQQWLTDRLAGLPDTGNCA
jgi:hypothetical protein